MAVVGVVANVVVDDQAALDVNDALEILRRALRRMAVAHRPGLWFTEDHDLLIAALELLLPKHQALLAALKRA
ncbi:MULTISPECIES: hypothetical protein [unclassified Caulobacter]|uniref:hypothetical protein n=1 Tax=unclassified Caulobacter TaxID=2648921 RepID=UPI001BB2577D|nr:MULTISPECIES: hypothetical protein [unclassified Caulobacter]MBQ1559805.1 hypothetical protein [Caulobacter sp.]